MKTGFREYLKISGDIWYILVVKSQIEIWKQAIVILNFGAVLYNYQGGETNDEESATYWKIARLGRFNIIKTR